PIQDIFGYLLLVCNHRVAIPPCLNAYAGGGQCQSLLEALLAQDAALQPRTDANYCNRTAAMQYLRDAIRSQSCSCYFVIRDIGEERARRRPKLVIYDHYRSPVLCRPQNKASGGQCFIRRQDQTLVSAAQGLADEAELLLCI